MIRSEKWQLLVGDDDSFHLWMKEQLIQSYNDYPGVIFKNGTRAWYDNNHYHRDGDLPAYIDEAHQIKSWVKYGLIHRENGPAHTIEVDGIVEEQYWISGERIK